MSVSAEDAAGNLSEAKSRLVTVDNQPPSVGDVTITGNAQVGQPLTCSANVDGQSATTSYQWLRANADGSGQAVIDGAIAASYTLVAADVGKKVLCRVTGTDGGGAATKTSAIAAGPFANGATVAAAPEPPVVQPGGGTGAGGAAGGTGAAGSTGTAGSNGGSGGTGSAGAAGGNGTAGANGGSVLAGLDVAAQTAATAVAPCKDATLKSYGTVKKYTRSYNHSAIPLSGRLVGDAGEPRSGRALNLVQTVVRSGTAVRTKIGTVRSAADGTFRIAAAPGPTRALQLVVEGCGSVGPILTERVRGLVQARTTTKRLRNRQTARIMGRVLGGYVGKGIPLELQVLVGKQWRDVKHTMSDSKGEFRVGYRFLRTYVSYTYRFRVVTRAGGAWPYMAAKSRIVKVRVN